MKENEIQSNSFISYLSVFFCPHHFAIKISPAFSSHSLSQLNTYNLVQASRMYRQSTHAHISPIWILDILRPCSIKNWLNLRHGHTAQSERIASIPMVVHVFENIAWHLPSVSSMSMSSGVLRCVRT